MEKRLILASESPRRYDLLNQIGVKFDVIPSRIVEDATPSETAREQVVRLAQWKAREVGAKHPDRWIVAADTTVCIEEFIFGKPGNAEEAMGMLHALSGREHRVLTAFSVQHFEKGRGEIETVETAVQIKSLSPSEMAWYVTTGEPFDKAGGYAVQGIGSYMIESIRGSYTNVVGLPLCELVQMLGRLGAIRISDRGIEVLD
jgi:septum formation protein